MKLVAMQLLGLWLCFLISSVNVSGKPNTVVTFFQCSPDTYPDGDPYGVAVNQALYNVANKAEIGSVYSTVITSNNGIPVIASGGCNDNANLTETECRTCLDAATEDMFSRCYKHMGSAVKLVDCLMDYAPV
ncbi:OLC1v1013499C1 [Oldenlandia corymbosa var. corymbosa]|uniref:OLC1v1013499C1 n=1 Tax=Oldenlandia corymbosa var. corymbosa TaxID=529605 RepID=A0AAV1E205_OLDCO|nr:OLC1v1013499C1 [Oldenlandia corymbosa var. corymbosa]